MDPVISAAIIAGLSCWLVNNVSVHKDKKIDFAKAMDNFSKKRQLRLVLQKKTNFNYYRDDLEDLSYIADRLSYMKDYTIIYDFFDSDLGDEFLSIYENVISKAQQLNMPALTCSTHDKYIKRIERIIAISKRKSVGKFFYIILNKLRHYIT